MKSTEKIELTGKEWFRHYETSFYLSIPIVMLVAILLTEGSIDYKFIYLILILLVAAVFVFWLNWNRLFFQEFKVELTDEQFSRAVEVTGEELDWMINITSRNEVEAYRFPEGIEVDGEKIIIKNTNGKIFINSIKQVEFEGRGYSVRRNRENVDSFLINIADILSGKNVEKVVAEKQKEKEEAFWEENEWTIGKILMRFFGYGMTFFFLLIGGLAFCEFGILAFYKGFYEGIYGDFLEGIAALTGALVISLGYVKSDIKILLEKRRRRSRKRRK